ncbi:NFX1-type zinc finger-containing protein 1-like [Mercenaria mercenaria]|uniref:NFX1-type zinc finger-containing protein 1-like n=1 Tax=Mercenaria mercenaria TaxID=6596 RepID=UPI00234E8634|nr:NFX1-type zinc finger-containing protein 1-like [Mercenaria mercenaria]
MSFSVEKEVKSRTNIRQLLETKKKEANPTTYTGQPATDGDEEAKTIHVLRSTTAKYEETKASAIIRRKLVAKDEEGIHTTPISRPSTEKDKGTKTTPRIQEPATTKDTEARNKANIRSQSAEKKENAPKTAIVQRPLTEKDKETENTAKVRPALAVEKEKPKSMSHSSIQVTSKDKESKTATYFRGSVALKVKQTTSNIRETVILKDKEHKNTANIRRPITAKEAKISTHVRETLTAKDKEVKISTQVREFMMIKDQEAKTKVNVRPPLTEQDEKVTTTAHIQQSLTLKGKGAANSSQIHAQLTSKDKESKKKTNICERVTSNGKESTVNNREPLIPKNKKVKSVTRIREPQTSKDEKAKNKANMRRPLTANDKGAKFMSLIHGTLISKDKEPINTANIPNQITAKDTDAEISAHVRETLTAKVKEAKLSAHVRKPLKAKDKEAEKLAHVREPLKAKVKEAEILAHVREPFTAKDKETEILAHVRESLTVKENEAKSLAHVREPLPAKVKEAEILAHIREPLTTEDKEADILAQIREPLTAKYKEAKLSTHVREPIMAKDQEARDKVNVRHPMKEKDEKAKTTANIGQPLTLKGIEAKYTSQIHEQQTSKDKESKKKSYIRGHVTSKDKESTAHIRESLIPPKDKEVATATHIREPLTSRDDKPKNTANIWRPIMGKDKESEISAHLREPMTANVQEARKKVNVRSSLTEQAEKATIATHIQKSLKLKDKKANYSSQSRAQFTSKYKESKKTINICGSMTSKDKENTIHNREPLIPTDKEVNATLHIREPFTSNDAEAKDKANVPQPLTANDKGAKFMSLIHEPLTSKKKESENTTNARRLLTTKDKESTTNIHDPVTLKDEEAKNKADIRCPLTTKGAEYEISTQAIEPYDQEAKTTPHIERPFTKEYRDNTTSIHALGQLAAQNKDTEIVHISESMTEKDKEGKCRAHISQPLTMNEKEVENSTYVWRQLAAKNEDAKSAARTRETLTANEIENEIKSGNVTSVIANGKHRYQKDSLLGEEVHERKNYPKKRTEADSKSVRLHTGSKTYTLNKNDLNLKTLVKRKGHSKKECSPSTTLSHRYKDEEIMGTSKTISKTGPVGYHCAESSENIPSLEKSFKGEKYDHDDNTNHANHVFNSNEADQDQHITSLRTLFSRDKDAENTTSEKVSAEYKTVRTDDKIREQKAFPEYMTEARCLDEKYRRHTQDENYLRFKIQAGNEADTDRSKEVGKAVNQENQFKKLTSDIRSKSTVNNNIEINGCRPKQKTNAQKEYVKSQAFGRKHQDTIPFSFTITGISFLKKMIDEDSDVVVSELTNNPSLMKDCIERTAKDETVMALFLQILSNAFSSKSSLQSLIPLFESLKMTGFFDILVEYLARIIVQIKSKQTDGYTLELVLKHILSITIEQITRNPSSLVVFRKVLALMGQVIDELVENGTADDEVIAEYQRLTEQKKAIEKEGRKVGEPYQYSKPPDDFRQYPVSPSADEITGKVKPFLRPNTIYGGYENLNDYLDVQFRLLREDFVGPLREGMTGYIDIMTSHKKYGNTSESLRNLDIKVYENVRVHSPVVSQHGLCYKLKLQMNANLKRLKWKFSKRLIYGSMVCLTDNDFKNFFLASVVEREEKDIKHGFFTVHFEREDVSTKDLLNNVFRMAETAGYFEAYRHVLSSLQTFNDGDLPFEKYIVSCERKINRPAYLAPYRTYDLRPLVDQNVELKANKRFDVTGLALLSELVPSVDFSQRSNIAMAVKVTDFKSWPSKELLQMDNSQYRAVQTALTNEFAIIQGPPGTGKTYIGLQIVKALLHNKSAWAGTGLCNRPMLIVCYTNHALDQFLEGIVKYFKGDVLRVGGRSSSTDLEQFNLKKYRQMRFKRGTTLARLQYNKRQARRGMESQSRCVQRLAKTIQVYQTEILTEDILSLEMGQTLYDSLVNGYRGKKKGNFSYIVKWLGIEYLKRECQNEIQNATKAKKCKHVRVEDETARMQKERMIDIEENLHFSANEKSLLWKIRETDVAFFVEDPKTSRRHKRKEHNKGTIQDKHFLKLFKSTIVGKITDEDVMSQEEADNIKDVWRLNHKTKWRLYRLWIRNMCANLYEEIEAKRRHFEAASENYRDALVQVDKEIMRQVAVIGMTTSGAARYQSVLREIGPRIIIVEEAAEVLEAHIITTLSKGCEHLILIGDHKQLRPNPTVYKLAVKYNLDISLFERMVKNGMQFNCLELQHRMRPEISSIMRHIYPDLKDHEHVKTYPNVKGISTNLFLINHAHLESCNDDIKSYVNTKEAEYAVALCRYLLLQGYERQDITVLTTYTGQLMYMRNLMPEEEFEGVNVTVVDNYQGEENKIVILSLVRSNTIEKIGFLKIENRICVALSRAKVGFFVIGNFDHLANHSTLWRDITTDTKAKNCFGDGLALYCQNHPSDNAIVAKDPEDFKRAPEGGCMKKCDVRLECGHKCERHCHVLDKEHKTNKCQKPCTKTCELRHKCPLKCFSECIPCSELVRKLMPECKHFQLVPCAMKPVDFCCQEPCEKILECGHPCKNTCGDSHTNRCLEKINFIWPCGHMSTIVCWEANSKLCPHPCGTELHCKHICSGTCGTCLMGRVHQPCRVTRIEQHFCGHQLPTVCQNYPICVKPCEKRCSHGICTKRCGEPCEPCRKPCLLKCPHTVCRRRCYESCDRRWCNMPCEKLLKCKHKCIGLCGEPCPNICRWCHKKIFKAKTFGNKHKQDARFILLEDCGHLVEYRVMDANMTESTAVDNVRLKCCLKCKTPIGNCLRYGNIIKPVLKDIERAKKDIIGDITMYDTLKYKVSRVTTGNAIDSIIYLDIAMGNLSPEDARTQYPSHYCRSLCKKALEERLVDLKAKGLYTKRQLVTVQKQYEIANEIIDLIQNIIGCDDSLKHPETEKDLLFMLHEVIRIVVQPRDILTKQENEDFRQEILRGQAYVKFLKTKKSIKSSVETEDINTDVRKIESILLDKTRFTQAKEKEINELFERLSRGLPITEEEIKVSV